MLLLYITDCPLKTLSLPSATVALPPPRQHQAQKCENALGNLHKLRWSDVNTVSRQEDTHAAYSTATTNRNQLVLVRVPPEHVKQWDEASASGPTLYCCGLVVKL